MAQGNWDGAVVKAKPRCLLCRRVVLARDMVRLDGVAPAHKVCAEERKRTYTEGTAIRRLK